MHGLDDVHDITEGADFIGIVVVCLCGEASPVIPRQSAEPWLAYHRSVEDTLDRAAEVE